MLLPTLHIGLFPPSPPGVSVVRGERENDSPTHPISLPTDDGGGWDVLHLVPLPPLLVVGGEQLPLPIPCTDSSLLGNTCGRFC